ncbi:hypothetical protein AGMMS50255_6510 [Spirochaetia bacterium]|nr:hypothetical protein AGMMS50255_6510 [Spirochaetia bacterium]
MSKEYKLNLYQNSIDSLNEGLNLYKFSLIDESKYKFCIIIITHFMELMLKHLVELQNPLLCYEKPFSKSLEKEKTITWGEATQIIINSKYSIAQELLISFKELTNIRNTIVHYKFNYNTSNIRKNIICVINGLRALYKNIAKKDLFDDVLESSKEILKTIESEYSQHVHLAQAEVKEESDETGMEVCDCNYCGDDKTAIERENGEIYCYNCGEYDYEIECCRCYEPIKYSEAYSLGKTESGDPLYLCEYCNGILESDD